MDQPIAADGGMLGICAQPTMRPPTLAPRASGRAGASGHSVAGRPRFGTADAGASESVDVAAYYVVAAWLANPAKHAQASEVTVCTHGGRMSKLVFLSCRFARRSPIAVGAHGVLRLLTCAEAIRLASCGAFRIVAVPPRWVLSKRWFGRAWRCPVGKGAVSPGQGPLVRVEVVHESERTRVTRLFLSVAHGHPQGAAGAGCASGGCGMRLAMPSAAAARCERGCAGGWTRRGIRGRSC